MRLSVWILLFALVVRGSVAAGVWSTSPRWLPVVTFTPALANLLIRQFDDNIALLKWHSVPQIDRAFEGLSVSPTLYHVGDAMLWITALGAALAYNTTFSADGQRKLYVLLQVLCMEEGISGLLKVFIDRVRPDASDRGSFPSAHAAFTFAWAAFVATDLYRQHYSWLFPYLLASFTAFTRIGKKKHYFTDVVAGGLLGALLGYYLYDFHFDTVGRWRGDRQVSGWHIYPQLQLSSEGRTQFALQATRNL